MMNIYSFVNILTVFVIFFYFLCLKYHGIKLFLLLKYIFEASLIGAIADTYAVFGLFYKIGPHTDILKRKKKEIIERVKDFVSEFLFSKDFLDNELSKIEINVLENIKSEELRKILKQSLMKHQIIKRLGDFFVDELTEKISKILTGMFSKSKNLNLISKDLIKQIIIKNHHLIEELIEKRLNEVDDEKFIEIIKKSSWSELQWIRLNGIVLGGFIGLIIGIFNLY